MKILVDAFGGDNSPSEIIKGAIEALNEDKDFTLGLTGSKEVIEKHLESYKYDKARVEVIDAPTVIGCDEEPTLAIRKKPDSSMCVAFKMLKDGEADAFVSAGSSGALLVGATLKVGRIKGVNRPALCPILPTLDGTKRVVLLDAGANSDCKAVNLLQFAVMGSAYAELALGIKNPKVALLSNGTEEGKGNQLNKEVYPLLKQSECINFAGNIEARDILSGEYDVVVADGFSGNIALKSIEGTTKNMLKLLKAKLLSSFKGKLAGLMLKNTVMELKTNLDYNNFGGAMFLGTEKIVVKSHGSSKSVAIKNSVLQAVTAVRTGINDKIRENLFSINMEGLN